MQYRKLDEQEINRELFKHFDRYQVVENCWRKVNEEWTIQKDPFIEQWSEKDYEVLVDCMKHTIRTGGVVFGAFEGEKLKGFAAVEGTLCGSQGEYLDLASLHVSKEMRGSGIGSQLFARAAGWALEQGASKLYISSHSAVETQAFYRGIGCSEAKELQKKHVEQEPYDCQLEYVLEHV